MPKKKKLKLSELKVQSLVTLDEVESPMINGGTYLNTFGCTCPPLSRYPCLTVMTGCPGCEY